MRARIAIAALLALLAAWWFSTPPQESRPPQAPPLRKAPAAEPAPVPGKQWLAELPETGTAKPAWESMAQARQYGDPRTPPIEPARKLRSGATAAQLADPKAYSEYEKSEHARVLAAFVAAAETELPILRADVERGRAAGIAPDRVAKVEEKIVRIERLRAQILAGQVPGK